MLGHLICHELMREFPCLAVLDDEQARRNTKRRGMSGLRGARRYFVSLPWIKRQPVLAVQPRCKYFFRFPCLQQDFSTLPPSRHQCDSRRLIGA